MNPIALFYPGTHRDYSGKIVEVSRSDLESAVAHFNQSRSAIPLVVGHPDDEGQSFGTATELAIDDAGVVRATKYAGLDSSFQKIVNSGELPKISVKLRLPGHPKNSHTGVEFQHIGFFGRSAVALDKLPLAKFSAPNPLEAEFMPPTHEELAAQAEEQAKKEKALADREAAFALKEASFAAQQAVSTKLAPLVAKGQIPPAHAAKVTSALGLLAVAEADKAMSAAFSSPSNDNDNENQPTLVDSIIAAFSAKAVPLGQQSANSEDEEAEFAESETMATKGATASAESLALDKKASALMKKHGCSYEKAVAMASGT